MGLGDANNSIVNDSVGGAADEAVVALNTTHRGSDGSDHSIVGDNEIASGLNTTVSGLNTSHRGSDGSDHSKVGANETAIGLNTSHRGSDGSDHSKVSANETASGLNTAHRGSDGSNHSKVGANETAIGLNTSHRSSDGSNHSKVGANETASGLNTSHREEVTGNPHNVKEFNSTVYFDAEVNNGDSGSSDTIDWTGGNKQKSTLTDDCTFTFDPEPAGPCSLILKLIQGGTGSYIVTWPGDVNWTGNIPPELSTAVGAVDLISFYYDGSEFHGQAMFDSRNS